MISSRGAILRPTALPVWWLRASPIKVDSGVSGMRVRVQSPGVRKAQRSRKSTVVGPRTTMLLRKVGIGKYGPKSACLAQQAPTRRRVVENAHNSRFLRPEVSPWKRTQRTKGNTPEERRKGIARTADTRVRRNKGPSLVNLTRRPARNVCATW